MYENKSIFETLFEINVNDHIEKKKDLTYLSWPYAWAEVKRNIQKQHIKYIYLEKNNSPMFLMKALGTWFLQALQLTI